jgi:hypothetical protein
MFLEFLLLEHKIIVISSHSNILTFACEAMLALCYPFTWDHIYIPILPARLLSYLQAPVPFLVGINREYFDTPVEQENRPADAVLIDLDKDTITYTVPPLSLPSRERRKLLSRIRKFVPAKSPSSIECMTTFCQTFPRGKHVSICSFSSRLESCENVVHQELRASILNQIPSEKKHSTVGEIPDFEEFKNCISPIRSPEYKSFNSVASEPMLNLSRREVFSFNHKK